MNESKYRQEIAAAIERARSGSNPEWVREFTACVYIAAVEHREFQIDDVWTIFRRRGSGLETPNKMAAGAIMRRAYSMGWIVKSERPAGVGGTTANHNREGTGWWASTLYEPRARVPDSFMREKYEQLEFGV